MINVDDSLVDKLGGYDVFLFLGCHSIAKTKLDKTKRKMNSF